MKKKSSNHISWILGTILMLGVSYWICRFAMFEFHGMKQYPTLLGIIAFGVLILSLLLKKYLLSLTTILGYLGGFVIACLFNSDGVDPGGGRTNNLWIIWTVMFLLCIVFGMIIEILSYQKKLDE